MSYALMGAGTGLVTRLLQHLLPTPLESGQLESLADNLELARRRLASEEARTITEWKLRSDLQQKQLDANRKAQIDNIEMQRWPLGTQAGAFCRYSQGKKRAALNVVIYRGYYFASSIDQAVGIRLSKLIEQAAFRLEEIVTRYFGGDIILYRETGGQSDKRVLSGQQLVSTLSSLTNEEPSTLIEITGEDAKTVAVSVTCWGWSGGRDGAEPGMTSKVRVPLAEGPDASTTIVNALLVLIGTVSDQFQLLRRLTKPPRLSYWQLTSIGSRIWFESLGHEQFSGMRQSADEMTRSTYLATLSIIAEHSPLLAGEAAASAACDAHAAERAEDAELFLAEALKDYRRHLRLDELSEAELVQSIAAHRNRASKMYIVQALVAMRGIDAGGEGAAALGAAALPVDPLELLEQKLSALPAKEQQVIREKLREILSRIPKVGVFGKAGVGKSSLCNRLFGKDAFYVSAIEAGTRAAQRENVGVGDDGSFMIIDMPGVGESLARDAEYEALYSETLDDIDVMLWIVKADDRALSIDQAFYERHILHRTNEGKRVIFVINQVDKIPPHSDWSVKRRAPGFIQQDNIEKKIEQVCQIFGVDGEDRDRRVVTVSALESYGIEDLLFAIVTTAPPIARPNIVRSATPEAVSPRVVKEAEKAVERELFSSLGEGGAIGAVGLGLKGGAIGFAVGGPVFGVIGLAAGAVAGALAGSAVEKAAKAGFRRLKQWFS